VGVEEKGSFIQKIREQKLLKVVINCSEIKMNFQVPKYKKFDVSSLSEYSYGELHCALKITTRREYGGPIEDTQRARQLATSMMTEKTTVEILRYFMSLQGKVDLKLTPFSIESMARSRFYDYETDEKSVRFGKMIIPKRLGFVDYTGMEDQLRKAFPNSTVIAFSESWAFNVNIMASYTRSVRTGDKVRIDYGNYSYMENMFQAGEILQDVMEQLEPKTSMCGYEWASWLYHTLWKSKVDLMGYLAQVFAPPESKMTLVDKVVVWNRPLEIDTFKIHVAPNKAEEFLPLMQRYQLIRGQNSSPRSAMTYSMYGSDFGPDMALAEDLSGFRHYLDYLKDIGVPDGSKILYHSDSERALMCAAVILKKYKYMLHHTQNFVIEGFSGATDNAWDLSSVYVYDPNQISDNGFTVNNEKSLEKYRAKQKKHMKLSNICGEQRNW